MPGNRARVPRIAQPGDVEPFTEMIQVDSSDIAFTGVVERLLQCIDRADCAGADLCAEIRRTLELRLADDERT